MTLDLNGKKAIVLGGSSGIGKAIVEDLVQRGCHVVCGSRRGNVEGLTGDIVFESVDVLDREGLRQLFEKHAPFDFLINAATGGERAKGPFLDMNLDGFQGSFAKLWGYTNSVHIGVPYMQQDGAVVLISGSPARKCAPGMLAISTVGNAVEGFIRAVAPELAPIRINGVSPGLIDTPMFAFEGEDRKNYFEQSTKENAIPRAGTPQEISQGVMFVLQNQFVTGTIVDVDGGALLP